MKINEHNVCSHCSKQKGSRSPMGPLEGRPDPYNELCLKCKHNAFSNIKNRFEPLEEDEKC